MSEKMLIDMDDLMSALSQLDDQEDTSEPTEEELASQRRYEEIIKKHKND